jgi:hypothetical protein
MDIAAGLSGMKAAAEMTKMLRERLKAGSIKPDEIAGRIGEIYDYMLDSKVALVEAQEEIAALKEKIRSLDRDDLVNLDGGVYWEKRSDGRYDGPLCPLCWSERKRLPMVKNENRNNPEYIVYECSYHYQDMVVRKVPKSVLERWKPEHPGAL